MILVIMESVETVLTNYFNDLKSIPHHSNFSWENCYEFFYNNRENIVNNNNLLELAALYLAFYLASWGMYRGDTFLRQYDHTVYKDLIITLLTEHAVLFSNKFDWTNLKNANKTIIKYFNGLKVKDKKKYKNKPTKTLITKILMGIFACVPAYDRFFIEALKKYNEEHKKEKRICQTYNKASYKKLKEWSESNIDSNTYHLSNSVIEYTPMKLVDVYFWSIGKSLEEERKKERKKNKEQKLWQKLKKI